MSLKPLVLTAGAVGIARKDILGRAPLSRWCSDGEAESGEEESGEEESGEEAKRGLRGLAGEITFYKNVSTNAAKITKFIMFG